MPLEQQQRQQQQLAQKVRRDGSVQVQAATAQQLEGGAGEKVGPGRKGAPGVMRYYLEAGGMRHRRKRRAAV